MQWLVEVCIARPVFTVMMTMAVVVLGVLGFISLGVDRFPDVDFPTVTVTVINPGAAPSEIESEITKKIEDQVNTISGIDSLTSTSSEGMSQVMVGFILSKDVNVASQEVKEKVNLILNELPRTAEELIVQKLAFDSAPVLQVALSGPFSAQELYHIADKQVRDRIENVAGVGEVTIVGGGEREIQIALDPQKMLAFDITATDITLALQKHNQETPAGRIQQGPNEINVRTIGRVQELDELKDIPIIKRDEYSVSLGEVAEVIDGTKETRSLSLLNGIPAVTLQIRKQSGENTLAVSELVKTRLKEIESGLPPNVNMRMVGDQSIFIQAAVTTVEEHLIIGSILACIVIFLFLWNGRMTLIAAFAIPTSIIGTFALMWVLSYTLNTITMLALTLMIGIVIDDAIVVLENIHRFIVEKGMDPFQAAIEGTREVSLAVMATTFSLLAVFLPVGFMGGIIGKFMSSFGLTASIAIAISLFISFSLTPMLSSCWIKRERRKPDTSDDNAEHQASKWSFEKLADVYVRMLKWSIRFRWVIVISVIVVLASNVVMFSIIGMDFIPEDDESQFQVTIETAQGTSLSATRTVAERVAEDLRRLPGVTETLTTVGDSNDDSAVRKATVYTKLVDIADRDVTQAELLKRAREILKGYPPEIKTTVGVIDTTGGGGSNAAIQYILVGPAPQKLAAYSERIVEQLKQVPEAIEVDSSLVADKPELRISVDRRRAADLGVAVNDISETLNILLTGSEVTAYNSGGDLYNVRVRAAGIVRQRIEDLKRMSVRSEQNEIITLDQLVTIETGASFSAIDRYNRQNQVTIFANLAPGAAASTVSTKLDAIVAGLGLDPGYQIVAEGSSQNINDSIYYFGLAFVMSFIFMYMILASQFESYVHPVTILLTLPLSIPFGLLSLIVTEQSLNLFALLGILVLFGIVKKNAILQIDHTIGLRAKGMARDEAIILANRDRLRPILMTTFAFVAGMLPLLIGTGSGAAANRSIGTLVAGGQTFCLLLTLLAVPVFYSIFDDWGNSGLVAKTSARWRLFRQALKRRARFAFQRSKISVGRGKAQIVIWVIASLFIFTSVNSTQAQDTARSTAGELRQAEVEKERISRRSPSTESNAASDLTRVGVENDRPLLLSLQDAIRRALEHNNEIKTSETDVKIAEFALRRERGGYEPVFASENLYKYSKTPSSSSFQGGSSTTEKGFSSVAGVNGKVSRFGGSYIAEFQSSRTTSDEAFNSLNPQYLSKLSFGYVQPLLRGRQIDESRRSILVAKKNVTLSDAQFRQRVIQTIADIEVAYFDLVFALKNLQVQESGVRDALAQLQSNERQVEEGVIAPIDIVQAQKQVITFQQSVYLAKAQLTEAENRLKSLILPNREDDDWTRPITPTSEGDLQIPRITLSEAVKMALESRPELVQINTDREINRINTQFYKDQTKPQIDLLLNYSTQGLAGTATIGGSSFFSDQALTDRVNQLSVINNLPPLPPPPTFPNALDGNYVNSLGRLASNKYPSYQVGVRFSLPIGRRQAKADLGGSLAEGSKIEYQLAQQRQNIEKEVRNAIELVGVSERRWELAVKARELSQSLYEGERRQLLAGTSTVYLVLERQTELVASQASAVQARIELNKAISAFRRAIGTALSENGVLLQPPHIDK